MFSSRADSLPRRGCQFVRPVIDLQCGGMTQEEQPLVQVIAQIGWCPQIMAESSFCGNEVWPVVVRLNAERRTHARP